MNKLFALALLAAMSTTVVAQEAVATSAAPAVKPVKGKMLYAANGGRLGSIYRVNGDGSVQLILDGAMRTIPGTTLSLVDGKLTTSLSKSDVISQ